MTSFKANIIKLDRCIIYQPLYVDESLIEKAKRYSDVINFKVGNITFGVYYLSAPTLRTNYVYLGFDYSGRGNVANYRFLSNEERDIYYDKLLSAITQSIDKLKSE